MATSPPSGWTAVVLEAPFPLEDEVLGALAEGSLGLAVTDAQTGGSRVAVYFASVADARELLDRIPGRLGESCRATLEAVEDLRWVERYQAGLVPFRIGARFVVVPHGGDHEERDRTALRLVPGQAFGTGEHETTRLCVEALERSVRPGARWLDLGTGTGILALVAAHCGAGAVEARDVDPEAVQVATEVVATNGMEARIRVAAGSMEDLAPASFDGVVANIAAGYFLASPGAIAAALRGGGVLLAAGLLATETVEVGEALARVGLGVEECRSSGEWALLVAHRVEG